MPKLFKAPTSDKTTKFYDDLIAGRIRRGLWGAEARFDGALISTKESVRRHFTPNVATYIRPTDVVLDVGCGSGGFLPILSGLCAKLVGIDITPSFVAKSMEIAEKFNLANTEILQESCERLPFENHRFDVVVMLDVIHHMENVRESLKEVHRVLTPAGRVIVFEPNKLNPLVYVMCMLDPNERGVLPLGTKGAYRRLFAPYFTVERIEYNGMLIGPQQSLSLAISDVINHRYAKPLLGWLNARMFIALTKPQ
ncbi:class I SAM-dependent methyltransferase [Candidatus Magnetobacterium casense]|uniref:Class I SAM-dependent methyltransferase n=1 Tax=Candidatus Magnetobacterium casense TaxID=1455061 RepID=A0ABS6RYL4_9BACT|nr:class I SAM-dependent methyltransferase [Candidatus Magnetobacterium casensis]MBV6341425.1 class I SAM-dependent methyltransferase [Candidatus Magnetobacterium casensis]